MTKDAVDPAQAWDTLTRNLAAAGGSPAAARFLEDMGCNQTSAACRAALEATK